MPRSKVTPTLVIFVTRDGVAEVQIHSPTRQAEPEATALYERIRPIVDRLDRTARAGER